jgi:hypothetical protein
MLWICADLCCCCTFYYSDANRGLTDQRIEVIQGKNSSLIDDIKSNQDLMWINNGSLLDDIVASMSELN